MGRFAIEAEGITAVVGYSGRMATSRALATLLFALAFAACKTRGAPSEEARPVVIAPSASASASAMSASASASVAVDAGVGVEQELRALAQRWNDALAKRDADALRAVYGARVAMYGAPYDREAAIAAKKKALTADYTQSIASIHILRSEPDRPAALFEKTWTTQHKTSHVHASLQFAKEDDRWVVVEETDGKTEQLLWDASCLGLVYAAIESTDEFTQYRSAGSEREPYVLTEPCSPPECAKFQIKLMQIGHDYGPFVIYDVDQVSGVVSRHDDGVAIKADAAIVARMKLACAREAAQRK